MTVFAGAIAHRVVIAGVDVSELVGGDGTVFGVSDEKISRGLIKTSGTLQIMDNGSIDLDSRTNPTFSRGAPVIVEVKFRNSETWLRHPRGALRIIRDPAPPYPGKDYIEIEVGCLLTLLDFASPPDKDKQDEETKKQEKPRHQIINEILANLSKEQGIPNIQLQGTIPDYPLAVAADKLGTGSYIELCGDIAFGGGHALWIDANENLRAVRVVPSKISHNFPDIVIGGDDGMEISYKSITGMDIPPSKYLFTAEGDPSDGEEGEDEDDGCMTHRVYGSMADLEPNGATYNELWLIEEKKCDKWIENGDEWIREITTTIRRRQGLVYQAINGQGHVIAREGIQERWYYNSDGILYKRETSEQRMLGELLKELMDNIPEEFKIGERIQTNYRSGVFNRGTAVSVRPVKKVLEEWFFSEETGVIERYTKVIQQPKGSVTAKYYKFENWKDIKYKVDGEEGGEEEEETIGGEKKEEEGKKMFPAEVEEKFGYWPYDSANDLVNNAGWIMHLVPTYKEEQTWQEFRKDEWQWNKMVWQSQGKLSSGDDAVSREDAIGLRLDMEESEYILSNSGDSQPPEPETMSDAMQEESSGTETENIECEVEMQAPAYAEYRPKQKDIRLEFIKDKTNLCEIGNAIATLDQGRVWLHELVIPLRQDIVENFKPVGFIKVQEYRRNKTSDRTFIYIAEGISWTLENDSALLSMDLILYKSAPNFFVRTSQVYPKLNPPPLIPTNPNDPLPPTPIPIPVPNPVPAPVPTPTPTPPIIIPQPVPILTGGWKHGGSAQWFNFDPNTPEEFNLVAEWNYGGMTIHGAQIFDSEGEYLHGSSLSEAYIPYVKAEYLWGYSGKLEQIIPTIINAEAWVGYGGNLAYVLGEIYELTGGFTYGGVSEHGQLNPYQLIGGFVYGGTSEYEDQSSAIAGLNPLLWFEGDMGLTIDTSTGLNTVSIWQNQGSSGNAIQTTKTYQPELSTLNGLNVLHFKGSNGLELSSFDLDSYTSQGHFSILVYIESTNKKAFLSNDNGGYDTFFGVNGSSIEIHVGNGPRTISTPAYQSQWTIFTFEWDNSNNYVARDLNYSFQTTDPMNSLSDGGTSYIGNAPWIFPSTYGLLGKIAALFFCNRRLTSQEFASVKSEWNTKWGLSL